mmetsp:Transcript_55125/g.178614  ORF Transcript_55125/g.178614 Transcript_55125/m.178614 type:complete len:179 (-) Transcript_55125:132-668(-)
MPSGTLPGPSMRSSSRIWSSERRRISRGGSSVTIARGMPKTRASTKKKKCRSTVTCSASTASCRTLKQALNTTNKLAGRVDQFKAHDVAEAVIIKVTEVIGKADIQLEEYTSFVDSMAAPEVTITGAMGGVQLSGRGIRQRYGDDDRGDDGPQDEGDEGSGGMMARFISDVTSRLSAH